MTEIGTITVWENSSGKMFIAWHERQTSAIYPDEPGNIKAFSDIVGVPIEKVQKAVDDYLNTKKETAEA